MENNSLLLEKLKMNEWPEAIVTQSNIKSLFSSKYNSTDSFNSHLTTFKQLAAAARDSLKLATIEALKSEIEFYKDILTKFKSRLLDSVYSLILDYSTKSLQNKNKGHLAESESFWSSCNAAANHAIHITLVSLIEIRLSTPKISSADESLKDTKRADNTPLLSSNKPNSRLSVSFNNDSRERSKRPRSKSPQGHRNPIPSRYSSNNNNSSHQHQLNSQRRPI
jgi:hypothetical protein